MTRKPEVTEEQMLDTLKYLHMLFERKDDKAGTCKKFERKDDKVDTCKKYKEMIENVLKKNEYNYLNLEKVFDIFNKK